MEQPQQADHRKSDTSKGTNRDNLGVPIARNHATLGITVGSYTGNQLAKSGETEVDSNIDIRAKHTCLHMREQISRWTIKALT